MTVRIVTDSTADISPELAETLGITVVPLTVFFGDDAYRDNIDLDNASFYQKLAESKDLPRTSQPSPAAFQEAYKGLIAEGATSILSVHLSSGLSGTYQSARTARDTLAEEGNTVPIEVVDSKSVSAGMFLALEKAAQEAKQGLSLEEIKANYEDRQARTRIIVVLDSLEYVRRGGRIGGAKSLLGNMLSVKPIITLKDGSVVPLEQPRTRNKAYARAAQIALELSPIEQIAIAESNDEVGTQMLETLKTVYQGDVPRYKLGAVLGTHTGPGTVAFVVMSKKK